MGNINAYVQPNVGVVSSETLFAGEIQAVDVEGAANFTDLYAELTEVNSAQNKAAAMMLLQLVEKAKLLLPANRIWVPAHVESTHKPSDFDIDTPGITFISPQKNSLVVKKDEMLRNKAIKDGNIGFIFNAGEDDSAHIEQLDKNKIDQRIFIISGSVNRR